MARIGRFVIEVFEQGDNFSTHVSVTDGELDTQEVVVACLDVVGKSYASGADPEKKADAAHALEAWSLDEISNERAEAIDIAAALTMVHIGLHTQEPVGPEALQQEAAEA